MDDRVRITDENINLCIENREHMSDWENGFITSLHDRWIPGFSEITQKQFNKLHDIVQEIKKRKFHAA
jgi:hypothetical protein